MRKIGTILLIIVMFSLGVQAQEQEIFRMRDPKGDDFGAGALLYPNHAVYVPGLFDLQEFAVAFDQAYVYFDFQFAVLTNPFQAPEGYFHQRLEVYIDTEGPGGSESIQIGPYQFKTVPKMGWEVRLKVAPFGESRLFVGEGSPQISEGVSCFVAPDGRTIRVQVDRTLLPEPNLSWRYYVLVGAFDGLSVDFWRDLGDGPWQVGGEGPPIFDLLAPRWGGKSQKAQLEEGLLRPVMGKAPWMGYIKWGLISTLGLGTVFGGFFLWRWNNGRT